MLLGYLDFFVNFWVMTNMCTVTHYWRKQDFRAFQEFKTLTIFFKIRCFLFNKADIAWILRTLPATLTYWIFWKDFIILGLAREYIVIIRHTPWKPITTTWLRLSRHKFLWLRFFTFQNRFSVLLLSDSSRYVFTSTHVSQWTSFVFGKICSASEANCQVLTAYHF